MGRTALQKKAITLSVTPATRDYAIDIAPFE